MNPVSVQQQLLGIGQNPRIAPETTPKSGQGWVQGRAPRCCTQRLADPIPAANAVLGSGRSVQAAKKPAVKASPAPVVS
ncbi:MAG TPA: hypothetical protein PLQ19_11690, partial [Aeromicrobium sp.]|nr:hypothetical protein [Aeromicrobium sp.]